MSMQQEWTPILRGMNEIHNLPLSLTCLDADANSYFGSPRVFNNVYSGMAHTVSVSAPTSSLYFKWVELNILTTSSKLTLTWYSVRLVHITISSRMLISGYRFLVKSASNSCNCWLVKWVRLRRCLLLFLLFFPSLDSSNWLSELSQLWLGNSKWYEWKISFYRIKKNIYFFPFIYFSDLSI